MVGVLFIGPQARRSGAEQLSESLIAARCLAPMGQEPKQIFFARLRECPLCGRSRPAAAWMAFRRLRLAKEASRML
jgi:hypothetical protein